MFHDKCVPALENLRALGGGLIAPIRQRCGSGLNRLFSFGRATIRNVSNDFLCGWVGDSKRFAATGGSPFAVNQALFINELADFRSNVGHAVTSLLVFWFVCFWGRLPCHTF